MARTEQIEMRDRRLVMHAVALPANASIGGATGDADLRDPLHAAGIHTPA